MLGMSPRAEGALVDPDLVNAGKVPVTEALRCRALLSGRFLRHDALDISTSASWKLHVTMSASWLIH